MTAGRLTVGRFTADPFNEVERYHAVYYRKFAEFIIRIVECTESEK